MKKNKRKGFSSYILDIIMFVIIAGGLIAFFRLHNINGTEDLHSVLKDKSSETEECYKNKGKGCVVIPEHQQTGKTVFTPRPATDQELHYKGPSEGEPYMNKSSKFMKKDSIETVSNLHKIDSSESKEISKLEFKLIDWPHFIPVEGSECWSVEDEVLSKHAVKDTVKYADKYREITAEKEKACSISEGTWIDSYNSKKIKKVDDVTVDYIVPLSVANQFGGNGWSEEEKTKFANDPENLVVVSKKSKEERDSKSVASWAPKDKREACTFGKNYTTIMNKYKLSIDDEVEGKLTDILSNCKK